MAAEIDYEGTLASVSRDIARLKKDFPQLRKFSPATNTSSQSVSISYEYHTHPALGRRGWVSGVPNPDADGVWFYIDFHDADSTVQIHTQPVVVPRMCLGNKIAFLLILEGSSTKTLKNSLLAILERHGARRCEPEGGLE